MSLRNKSVGSRPTDKVQPLAPPEPPNVKTRSDCRAELQVTSELELSLEFVHEAFHSISGMYPFAEA